MLSELKPWKPISMNIPGHHTASIQIWRDESRKAFPSKLKSLLPLKRKLLNGKEVFEVFALYNILKLLAYHTSVTQKCCLQLPV